VRVLIFSQYFTPEVTAARVRLQAFAAGLAGLGHEVEVICEVPNHPRGVVQEGYGGKLVERRALDGFSARYVWVYATPEKTLRTRLLFYGSYAAMATAAGLATRRADAILVSSPPLPAAAAAALAARRHRAPWVFDVRDLWPEAAVILGELSDRRVIRGAEWLERRLYADADAIVTVTEPFREDIAAKVDDPGKIEVIPNGTTQEFLDAGEVEVDRAELGLPEGRFVWTYAGNVGIAQGLEAAVDAAALLGEGFTLLVVGAGPRLAAIRERAASLPPGAVEFRGLMAPREARRHMRASDALLVPLDSMPELAKFVPSKLFDCCAVGRPTIVSAAGEASRLAEAGEAALCIEPGDPAALAGAVRSLREDPQLAAALGGRGASFAAGYLRERQVERLERILLSLRK
jgi:glycosyltransferase involved in cell wall biosynthesis